jgi:hypothetical protein
MAGQIDTNRDAGHISAYVTPFYNSEGPSITVGRFSLGLGATNETTFIATIRAMKREWSQLNFVELYVAAIRLYDLGYRKESIFWFYSAQYRGRLFGALLDEKKTGTIGSPGFELLHASDAFYQLAGAYINSYAFADTDYLTEIIKRVSLEGQQIPNMKDVYPDDIFRNESEWRQQNQRVLEGLRKLAATITEQPDEIRQKTAGAHVQSHFAGLTNKPFPELPEKDATAISYHLKHLVEQENEQNLEAAERDREALVKLGCFERRDFQLKNRPLSTNNVPEFVQMVTNSAFMNYNYALRLNLTKAHTIGLTAHCGDIPAWESLVSHFDSAKIK